MQPEEYHSAAMQHLESFLGSMSEPDQAGFGGALEELQAVLLLAGFALLRPVGKLTSAIVLTVLLCDQDVLKSFVIIECCLTM